MAIDLEGSDWTDENGYPLPDKIKEVPLVQSIIALFVLGGAAYGSCYLVYLFAINLMK
jgi:hypothetical protein